jgi:hypothetical protein
MSTLAQLVDGVIGVDSHRDTLAAAALSPVGGLLGQTAARTDTAGYRELLGCAACRSPPDALATTCCTPARSGCAPPARTRRTHPSLAVEHSAEALTPAGDLLRERLGSIHDRTATKSRPQKRARWIPANAALRAFCVTMSRR